MKMLNLLFRRDTRSPMLALTFASVTGVALVIARILVTRNIHYAYLVWNLFLAWLPLIFALLARAKYRAGEPRNWRFGALAGAWLLFFPNAPYIFTDFIHLIYGSYRHFWVDFTLILTCALTGLVLGFVSLYLMQSVVRRMYGQITSWFFIAGVAGLSGFGIYLGRFLRLNSWDVIAKPWKLYDGVSAWAANPMANSNTFSFPLLFGTFIFLAYVMLYTLTHLPRPYERVLAAGERELEVV
ncbi:MAG: DUF1361 domain-containing protein [Pedosphaera sp.]|nr:DUF1361 domain-containing protein [Pedosphaera sp.]